MGRYSAITGPKAKAQLKRHYAGILGGDVTAKARQIASVEPTGKALDFSTTNTANDIDADIDEWLMEEFPSPPAPSGLLDKAVEVRDNLIDYAMVVRDKSIDTAAVVYDASKAGMAQIGEGQMQLDAAERIPGEYMRELAAPVYKITVNAGYSTAMTLQNASLDSALSVRLGPVGTVRDLGLAIGVLALTPYAVPIITSVGSYVAPIVVSISGTLANYAGSTSMALVSSLGGYAVNTAFTVIGVGGVLYMVSGRFKEVADEYFDKAREAAKDAIAQIANLLSSAMSSLGLPDLNSILGNLSGGLKSVAYVIGGVLVVYFFVKNGSGPAARLVLVGAAAYYMVTR